MRRVRGHVTLEHQARDTVLFAEQLEEMIFFGEIPQQNMRNSVKF
jgi:hypothetical protein